MAPYEFLPLDNTATLIQAIAQYSWPLQEEDVRPLFQQAGLTLQTDLPGYFSHRFVVNGVTYPGSLAIYSFGIHRVTLYVCDYPENMGEAEAAPIATDYMLKLIDHLRWVFGEPLDYHDEGAKGTYLWWNLPSGACIEISYGTCLPCIRIAGPSHPTEPEDGLILLPVERCLELIQTWVDAPWPLSIPVVHSTCNRLNWRAKKGSSSGFYSELPYFFYQCVPPYANEDFFAEPDVHVRFAGSLPTQVTFELADYWSMRSASQAWPAMRDHMLNIKAALTEKYGEPEVTKGSISPYKATWLLPNDLSVTLHYGAGQSRAEVRHLPSFNRELRTTPTSIYDLNDAIEAIFWWAEETPRPLNLQHARQLAEDIDWFPEDTEHPEHYYTLISDPAQPRATIREENGQVWLITFDVAHTQSNSGGHIDPEIESAMREIEEVITDEYGVPEATQYGAKHYRDWQAPTGTRVRIAYGLNMSSVWIYAPEKKDIIDTFVNQTRAHRVKNTGGVKESSEVIAASDRPAIPLTSGQKMMVFIGGMTVVIWVASLLV